MATPDILRSRRNVAQLHATASVEREIRAYDRAGGRKYLRDFYDAYRSYQTVLSTDQVCAAVAESDIALVADYHALPSSQRFLTSLLGNEELHRRPMVVGLETIFARDQHIVDEWWRGEIEEAELRQRIRFDLDWGYDWAPFYELLSGSRKYADGLYGLDCMPREDLRKIGARDRHAAEKIAEMRRRHPGALLAVLFGESHLAPHHLPALVRNLMPDARTLVVLQNVDMLYWQAAGEKPDHIPAVRVADDVLCVFNSTPLEKYENYRLYLNRCVRDRGHAPDLAPTVFNLIEGLVRFLGIDLYSSHNTTQPRMLVDLMPEVYSRNSDALLRRLLSRRGFSAAQRRSMLQRVRDRGSAYLAPLNAFYIRRFDMTSAAEDATRFLHHACRGVPARVNGQRPEPLGPQDAFFAATLENALAYFGSRILYPARPAFRDADLLGMYELTREDLEQQSALPYADVVEILDFLSWHRQSRRTNGKGRALALPSEANGKGTFLVSPSQAKVTPVPEGRASLAPRFSAAESQRDISSPGGTAPSHPRPAGPDWTRVLSFTGRKWEYVTDRLGSLLGNDLYDAYIDGRIGPAALRRLFLAHIEEPGTARDLYANVNSRLR